MVEIRDILNELKWRKDRDIEKVEIWYRHRGAPGDIKILSGKDIVSIGKSFLETKTATIPYHRILKVIYEGELLFSRI